MFIFGATDECAAADGAVKQPLGGEISQGLAERLCVNSKAPRQLGSPGSLPASSPLLTAWRIRSRRRWNL
jgi:hypothetical protein